MHRARIAGIALVAFAAASVAWFALELSPPSLGFEDTDDPAVSLEFLRQHGIVYAYAGAALFAMAGSLIVASSAIADHLARTQRTLAARIAGSIGLTAGIFFFGHGVLRLAFRPMLHIDSLEPAWGEGAYLAVQMAGLHGFAQGGIVAFSTWAVAVSFIGVRDGFVPRWVAVLAVLPAFRLVTSMLGPFGVLEAWGDVLWIVFMAAILGSMLWPLALGISLTLRGRHRPDVARAHIG